MRIRSFITSRYFALAAVAVFALCLHFGLVHHDASMLGLAVLATAPFTVNPELTAVAIGYKNTEDALIADQVMPRVPTAMEFSWTKFTTAEAFTVPDTKVGRKSEPTQVSFTSTAVQDKVDDHGLDDFVPQEDIERFAAMPKASGVIDPEALSAMMLKNLILLAREVRVANTVFSTANYDNSTTLSGTGQWSDYANSNPLADLNTALDTPLVRPNTLVIGQQAWTVLRQHPKIVQAVFVNPTGAGMVSKQQLADLLELNEILIGNARVNTARKGQTAAYARTWGKHCALIYKSAIAAQTFQPTWGWTAQFGTNIAGRIPEPKRGLKGGNTIRVGEQVKEIVAAPGAGYLYANCVA